MNEKIVLAAVFVALSLGLSPLYLMFQWLQQMMTRDQIEHVRKWCA
jgi:cytochrome bd-type quinol oxidase subunit 1